jgi:uncharacterized protein (TIRG00374 family)
MSRRLQVVFFVFGAALFTFFVSRLGLAVIIADARRTGWMLLPLVLLTGVVYLCQTTASWLVLAGEPNRPPFWRLYAITLSGFSLNFITPMVNLGGEPYKVAALSGWLGTRRATGFVVLYQMLHSLAMVTVSATALLLAVVLLPEEPALRGAIAVALAGMVLFAAVLFWAHRHGGLERLLDLLHKLPLLGRLARRLEPQRATLALLDEQITRFYHADRRRFFLALGFEYLGRCLLLSEYFLILLSVGINIGLPRAFTIGALASLAGNTLFILPYELGAKEGALYFLFSLVGVDPTLGVYAALVSRVRDLSGIGAGLALIWAGRGAAGHVPPSLSAPEEATR